MFFLFLRLSQKGLPSVKLEQNCINNPLCFFPIVPVASYGTFFQSGSSTDAGVGLLGIYAVAWLRKRVGMDRRVIVGKVEDPLIGGWVALDDRNISFFFFGDFMFWTFVGRKLIIWR